jgi:hypothetical protein
VPETAQATCCPVAQNGFALRSTRLVCATSCPATLNEPAFSTQRFARAIAAGLSSSPVSADNTLNFFKSGGGCSNSAYCDVACHEFGHGVDAEFGDILDAAYSEGFGDSLAILITHDSIIGRDFLGRGMALRNAADVNKWPDVKDDPDPHTVGQAYAGFTWQLTRELIAKFGSDEKKAFDTAKELTLGAAALNPRDTRDAVRLVFFVDHENGSKFFKELANAADSRQIPRPDNPMALDNPANLNQP